MLGEAGGRVGVMVLDADELGVLLERPFRREVLGVEVVGDRLGDDVEHREVELEVGPEGAVGELGVEVAEVRREKRLAAAGDAEGALELGADGQDRPRRRAPAAAPPRARSRASGGWGTAARTTESSQRRWIGRS